MMRRLATTPFRVFRDIRAVSTVEFALILPVVLLMYAIMVMLSEAMIVKQDVVTTARTITDLVAQTDQTGQLSTATLQAELGAAGAVMTPWDTSNLSIVITELLVNSDGTGTVVWSQGSYNGTARTVGTILPKPSSAFTAGSYQLYGEVSYVYTPLQIFLPMTGPFTLSEAVFNSPRNSASITLTTP